MIENTLENKAKFFALYWGQEVLRWKLNNGKMSSTLIPLVERHMGIKDTYLQNGYLELTPLSQISDEDAWELASFCGYANANEVIGYRILAGLDLLGYFPTGLLIATKITGHYEAIDFLRSRGYALPWMGISEATLVEWGWVKLEGGEND